MSSSHHQLIKKRWLGFLIWQAIATAVVDVFITIIAGAGSGVAGILFSGACLHLAVLLLSLALFILSSPTAVASKAAPFSALVVDAVRAPIKALTGWYPKDPSFIGDLSCWGRRGVKVGAFLALCGVAGFLSSVAVCGELGEVDGMRLVGVGLRGVVFGLVYGLHYLYRRRWVLQFPIIQRPLFYSFKMGLLPSLKRALRLSFQAYLLSTIMMVFLPGQFKTKYTIGRLIFQQIRMFVGTTLFSFCWELSHHLLQVVLTRRCIFAPPQGSAAAATNPSETLLETLEQTNPRSLVRHLAYLDLSIVSESNCEPWRRAAFFEETGETYKRTINICLKPLEQLTSTLANGLDILSMDKNDLFSKQMSSPVDVQANLRLHEAFDDFQICSWCARTLAALTARSRVEDRYGVAQLTGCNIAVVSTLLSCLLAVEACLGRKTNLPASFSPANIKWATFNTGKGDHITAVINKRRSSLLHAKAYVMADVLRTSVYQIVSAFLADLQANAKASILGKNWISESKPLYGTREILLQKLSLFLEYQAV